MTRQRKDYAQKRDEILDAAETLFGRTGYDRTSVQAILEHLGISKGTFYHYFDSKEAVLEGVIDRFCERVVGATLAAVERPGLTALARLQALVLVPREWKLRDLGFVATVTEVAYQEAYAAMMQRVVLQVNAALAPHLTDVIRQGVAEGVFHVADAEAAAELFLAFMKTLGDLFGPELIAAHGDRARLERLLARASQGTRVLEHILGAAEGTFPPIGMETLAQVDQALTDHERRGKKGV
ncbi:MAG TPA: TetR/AcrR family transcriptional regulator [Oscillatoriaceae cyanobacterium]